MLPFIDLQAQFRTIQHGVEEAVMEVLRGGHYIMGPEVAELEAEFVRFTGARHCSAATQVPTHLSMALMECIRRGDAIFTPPFAFVATAEAIATVGATPVFVDVDPATLNMDPDKLDEAIGRVARKRGSSRAGSSP